MVNLYVSYINIGVIIGCMVCDGVGWVLSCDHCIILMFLHLNKDNRFEINCNLSTYHTVLRSIVSLLLLLPQFAVFSWSSRSATQSLAEMGSTHSSTSTYSAFVRHISHIFATKIWSNQFFFIGNAYGRSIDSLFCW